jgi:hypothetical protein
VVAEVVAAVEATLVMLVDREAQEELGPQASLKHLTASR